jgi:translation initiation factor IF-2
LEEKVIQVLDEVDDDPAKLQPRPPIVTFLGHVDHGKTSLLDRIIGIDVAAHEKGGITQHIRAYRVVKDGRAIAFVDTPGHEAFTAMRARGANVTDIAVLVVAAEDGIMPQTEEAISHARAAGVPIVVAMNKIDLPGANPQRVYEQLAANELLPSEWGGETEVVKTSATTGEGIDKLLETLLTVAELHEYKANPEGHARGTCIESELHEGRGVVAKLLIRNGTLRLGDVVVCGGAYGRVKAMYDTLCPEVRYEEVGPSTPVNVTGLDCAPGAGDSFHVLDDITQARELAEHRLADERMRDLAGGRPHVTLENLYERLGEEAKMQTLNIILRADVRGSIEAIRKELAKLEHAEVQVKVLQATVGGITEADVHLAHASDAIIIGFSVVPDEGARALAEKMGVQVRRYDIIYQLTDDLKAALEGMLRPEKREKELGRALVQRTFHISRVGAVAGCRVLAGVIQRDARVRLIRESRVIGDYALDSLKREKDDAREVREGLECGIKLANYNDIKEGDIFEAYKIEEVARTF